MRVGEFVGSKFSEEFFGKMKAYLKEKEGV